MDANPIDAGGYISIKTGFQFADEPAGEGMVRLELDKLVLQKASADAFSLPYLAISTISHGDYRIHLRWDGDNALSLFHFGYHYEDFLHTLIRLRNEAILKGLLMQETLVLAGVDGDFVLEAAGGQRQSGHCEARIYETALILMAEDGELVRVHFGDLERVSHNDYKTIIETAEGNRLTLSMMGKKYDLFTTTLAKTMNRLTEITYETLKRLWPGEESSSLHALAKLIKDSQAVSKSAINRISPRLWATMESFLRETNIGPAYDYLSAMAQQDRICIGVKRGLMGDLTGETVWFLIPIYSANPDEPGNAIAMEAASTEEEGGHATYFFRLFCRQSANRPASIDEMHAEAGRKICQLNRCLTAINFRREPIYLPKEQLLSPRAEKYLYAVANLPELAILREHFIGRVIHSSMEQWQNNVMDLLKKMPNAAMTNGSGRDKRRDPFARL